jgi:hypothetical protein
MYLQVKTKFIYIQHIKNLLTCKHVNVRGSRFEIRS